MGKALSKAEVKELFDSESILISHKDAVPLYRVKELFGEKAADFAYQAGKTGSFFGIGDYDLPYLNYSGFQLAASFYNVEKLRNDLEAGKEPAA